MVRLCCVDPGPGHQACEGAGCDLWRWTAEEYAHINVLEMLALDRALDSGWFPLHGDGPTRVSGGGHSPVEDGQHGLPPGGAQGFLWVPAVGCAFGESSGQV